MHDDTVLLNIFVVVLINATCVALCTTNCSVSSVVILSFSFSFFIPLLYSVTPWVLVILWEKC